MRLLLFLVRRNDRGLEARQPQTPQAETGTPERPNGVARGDWRTEHRKPGHRTSRVARLAPWFPSMMFGHGSSESVPTLLIDPTGRGAFGGFGRIAVPHSRDAPLRDRHGERRRDEVEGAARDVACQDATTVLFVHVKASSSMKRV